MVSHTGKNVFPTFFEHKPLPGTLMVGGQLKAPAFTPSFPDETMTIKSPAESIPPGLLFMRLHRLKRPGN
ncbi:hypothetical protein CXT98_06565 [Akkermansia muciniphila]|nr:hypothetical protein CXT98_06565 [Akkermansia muciniphila]